MFDSLIQGVMVGENEIDSSNKYEVKRKNELLQQEYLD